MDEKVGQSLGDPGLPESYRVGVIGCLSMDEKAAQSLSEQGLPESYRVG